MASKKIHAAPGTTFLVLLIAGFILLLLPQSFTGHLNFLFLRALGPVLRLGQQVQEETARFRPAKEEFVPKKEYDQLWKDYQNLHAQLKALHQKYETLAQFRAGLPSSAMGLVLADVTASGRGIRHELILNKGGEAGIRRGQYVLCESQDSVIGTVSEVSEFLSKVRLLTDPAQNIEIRIRRGSTEQEFAGRLIGNGKNACKIPLMDRSYDIREGDPVYAAAQTGRLEIPVIIGEISTVRPDPQRPLLWDITVDPIDEGCLQGTVAVIVPPEPEKEWSN